MSARSGRSTEPSTDRRAPTGGVDVYLLPAVVGGGLGDIDEVLAAGRYLARAGFRIVLYRGPHRPLPAHVAGPWEWPPIERRGTLVRRARAALTVTPCWGVSAAPSRPGRYGRGGTWEFEARKIEGAYGPDHTLHLSLEEFARTLTSRAETRERFREGGVRARAIPRRLRAAETADEVTTFRRAFRQFRALDRPNVLHLLATFRPDPAFGREFPEVVQVGPLGSGRSLRGRRVPTSSHGRSREWVWYASPASAERVAPKVLEGLSAARPAVELYVRSPRPWPRLERRSGIRVVTTPTTPSAWRSRFERAELRIVTGSRTLIEAMELGGPFLYFNGVLGDGARRRPHRPEKIRAWLDLARRHGVPSRLQADIADFARGRRVAEVVRRAVDGQDGWARFPRGLRPVGLSRSRRDAGRVVVAVARELARPGASASEIVARWRASNP